MSVFLEGTLVGLSLAFLFGFGPAFFALIQTAIYRGFIPGIFLAFGIFLNDLTIVGLSIFGTATISKGIEDYSLVGIIGGVLLVFFGIFTYRKKVQIENDDENGEILKVPHPIEFIGKGFLLNAVNPFVWIFWLSMIIGVNARFSGNTFNLVMFFTGTLLVVFATDIIKTFAASRLKKFATDKFLILINKVAGIAIVVFGLYLMIKTILQF